jgi:hypothetical protein
MNKVPYLHMPVRVWLEMLDDNEQDACDAIVEMEGGTVYTAVFVTIPYLKRQMDLNHIISKQLPDTSSVRYASLETPHLVVENIDRDTIEDVIDNLLAVDAFEGVFTRVTDNEDDADIAARTMGDGKRATTEVAAVVISDVLSVIGD